MATIGAGDLVAGRYRLVRPEGGSAAARVWEARDEVLGRTVTAREIAGRKRLGLAEAQTLARHNRVLDVVEEPDGVWIITSVGGGSPDAVGLARVGDLTTELDRPGVPRRPLAAASQPSTAKAAAADAAVFDLAGADVAATADAAVVDSASPDGASPDGAAAHAAASDLDAGDADGAASDVAAASGVTGGATRPAGGAPQSPVTRRGSGSTPPTATRGATAPRAAGFETPGAPFASRGTPSPAAAAPEAVGGHSGMPAADPWAGTAGSTATPAGELAGHGDSSGGGRPAGPAGTRGGGFSGLAARLTAPAAPDAARDRPVWRRPRTLLLATATLIVIGAGAGLALAATRSGGNASTGAQRPPATSPASGAAAVPAASGGAAGPAASGAADGPAVSGGTAGPAGSPKASAPDPTPAGAPAATFVPCGDGAPQGVMMGTPTTRDVPAGYVWHRDFQGFAFDVPSGWERSRVKNTFCFRDPAGGRGFVVTAGVSATDAATSFAAAERAARRTLPGYQRVSLTGNGWEYTWTVDGVVRHSRQVRVTPQAGTSYGVQWITGDARWAIDELVFSYILGTFEVVPKS